MKLIKSIIVACLLGGSVTIPLAAKAQSVNCWTTGTNVPCQLSYTNGATVCQLQNPSASFKPSVAPVTGNGSGRSAITGVTDQNCGFSCNSGPITYPTGGGQNSPGTIQGTAPGGGTCTGNSGSGSGGSGGGPIP